MANKRHHKTRKSASRGTASLSANQSAQLAKKLRANFREKKSKGVGFGREAIDFILRVIWFRIWMQECLYFVRYRVIRYLVYDDCRATLCVSAAYTVVQCLSVALAYSINQSINQSIRKIFNVSRITNVIARSTVT